MDRRASSAVLISLLLWGGCATTSQVGSIDVSLVNMSPGASTLLESSMVFTVRYQNSAPNPVTITGSSHKVYLEGTFIGEALSNTEVTVPQLDSATQDVVAHLGNLTLARTLFTVSKQQSLHYEIRSTIYGKSGKFNFRVSQTKSDTLNLAGLENSFNRP